MLPLASVLSTITSFVSGVMAFLPTALIVIGAASVIVKSVDAIVEHQIQKHPENHFWIYLDRALDRGDSGLGWIRKLIDGIVFDTQHRSEQ